MWSHSSRAFSLVSRESQWIFTGFITARISVRLFLFAKDCRWDRPFWRLVGWWYWFWFSSCGSWDRVGRWACWSVNFYFVWEHREQYLADRFSLGWRCGWWLSWNWGYLWHTIWRRLDFFLRYGIVGWVSLFIFGGISIGVSLCWRSRLAFSCFLSTFCRIRAIAAWFAPGVPTSSSRYFSVPNALFFWWSRQTRLVFHWWERQLVRVRFRYWFFCYFSRHLECWLDPRYGISIYFLHIWWCLLRRGGWRTFYFCWWFSEFGCCRWPSCQPGWVCHSWGYAGVVLRTVFIRKYTIYVDLCPRQSYRGYLRSSFGYIRVGIVRGRWFGIWYLLRFTWFWWGTFMTIWYLFTDPGLFNWGCLLYCTIWLFFHWFWHCLRSIYWYHWHGVYDHLTIIWDGCRMWSF